MSPRPTAAPPPGPRIRSARSGPPTLEEVAFAAGVSRSTASRAINGGAKVSPRAQAAVDDAIARLGYAPNRAARSLVTRRTDSIALVVPEPDERILADPFLAGTIRGVGNALAATELQLVLLIARPGDGQGRTLRYLAGGHVDGAIVVSHHRGDALEAALAGGGLPAVFVGRPFRYRAELVYVDVDNVEGARIATRRLIDAGRRRIVTIAGPKDMSPGLDRLAGWQLALVEAGAGPRRSAVAHGDFTLAGGAAAMERLLAATPDLDAVFAASDLMAAGALGVLEAAGRRVPEDVAVIGFDDLGVATTTRPPLTTVRNPVEAMVRDAAGILLSLIAGGERPPGPRIHDAELVGRESG